MFGSNTNPSTDSFSEKVSNSKNFIQISLVNTSEILTAYHKNKAVSFLNKISSYIGEFIFYGLALAVISILFFFNKLEPFNIFNEILVQQDVTDLIGKSKITRLDFTVKTLIAFIAILFVVIGFFIRSKRNAMSNLNIVTSKIKTVDANLKESHQELEAIFKTPQKTENTADEVLKKVEPKDILL